MVTNHGQIHDIAVVFAALVVAMCRDEQTYGVLGEHLDLEELAPRANVLVSRMVATRQVFDLPGHLAAADRVPHLPERAADREPAGGPSSTRST